MNCELINCLHDNSLILFVLFYLYIFWFVISFASSHCGDTGREFREYVQRSSLGCVKRGCRNRNSILYVCTFSMESATKNLQQRAAS